MKTLFSLFFSFLCVLPSLAQGGDEPVRSRHNFDFDWKFTLSKPADAQAVSFDDSGWQEVQLPHDWSVSLPYLDPPAGKGGMGFMQGGTGWYRKTFDVPANYRDQKVYIEFDGAYHRSTVYVNGRQVGFRPYGYVGFEYDLTPYLKYGEPNVLAVKVDHSDFPTSRWYSGSGIYRHVWLKVVNPVHVAHWGTFVTTPSVSAAEAEVRVVTAVDNTARAARQLSLSSEIVDASGRVVASESSPLSVRGARQTEAIQQLTVTRPELWDIDSPHLYTLVTTIREGSRTIDRYETPFGIREIAFDPDRGFFLNGRPVKMKGTNLHPDAGSLGVAVPDRSYERRLEILKEAGFNAIRCSHNPPSPEFLDYCDRLGFLVVDEAFDKWTTGYYSQYFDEWWQRDLDAMVLRDRNHPSVVLWSVGNEINEQNDMSGAGTARLAMLRAHVERRDPTRKVGMALMPTTPPNKQTYNTNGFAEAVEVVGYNYQEPFFEDDHRNFPRRLIYGSEVFPYYYPGTERMREYIERNPWYTYAENDYAFGYFIWTGVDYLGESSGWPSKGWPTAPFDVCMFEKPYAAFFRAVWKEEPTVNIAVADASLDLDPGKDMWSWPSLASHWTFPQYKGHVLEIQTMTNCEEVELLVNGTSMGRRRTADFTNNTIRWRAPYLEGRIEANGYNGGEQVASCELKTAGAPARIELTADRAQLAADGQDLSHVTLQLLDAEGNPVATDDRQITVTVEGAGRLLAVDNGDLRDGASPLRPTKPTYFGRALAVVQSLRQSGTITVIARTDGLPESRITITGSRR